jgi:integrase
MSERPTSLREALAEYLALRRALGFGLHNAGRLLGQYVGFLEDHDMGAVTTDNALSWASLPADVSPIWLAVRMSAVRGFATYLHSMGTADQVPPTGLVRSGPCRATADVEALVGAAGALRPRLRAATYQTLIGLLAVSGARVGEVIALDDSDLDRERALLSVRNTKFNKSRLVPLHATALRALEVYTGLRDELRRRPESPALFVSTAGTRLHHSNVGLTFSQLASQAGLTRRSASCRPRIHDMRH